MEITLEASERIRKRLTYYAEDNREILIIDAQKSELLDCWEIWKELYNSGVRGSDLNGFLRRRIL